MLLEKLSVNRVRYSFEVDGGVKIDNIAEIASAGADTCGRFCYFGSENYEKTISLMKEKLIDFKRLLSFRDNRPFAQLK